MKLLFYILICFISFKTIGQDSSKALPSFNYSELSINSLTNYNFNYRKLYSFNAISIGAKMGITKLTFGLQYSPIHSIGFLAFSEPEYTKAKEYSPNITANVAFYFAKQRKHNNPFVSLGFNTQTIKDYTTLTLFEYKTGYGYSVNAGSTFYIKNHFLFEPSLGFNTTFFREKNIYMPSVFFNTPYTEKIRKLKAYYLGINLKIAYIIPFKTKGN